MLIDIHTHILPYVDDGADSWDVSLGLLKQGEAEGIMAAVATPHILNSNDYKLEEKIITTFDELKQRANDANIKMDLFLGSEIYVQPDMALDNPISTINNNKKYFLVEFPMTSIPQFVAEKFFNFILEDKIPIIAHPERYSAFHNKPMLAYEFVQRGALMQINALSLLGKHGERAKSTAFKFVANNLAHFVASDCHELNHRTMSLANVYELVLKTWGKERAELLFYKNPQKIINGEKVELLEPLPFEAKTKKPLWKRLKIFQ